MSTEHTTTGEQPPQADPDICYDFTPNSCRPNPPRRWPYIVSGYVLFIVTAALSITTILTQEETIAAPMVVVQTSSTTNPTAFGYGPQP